MTHSDESAPLSPLGDEPGGLALRFGEQSQLDFDLAFFERLLEREPDYLDVLRCQGELLTRKGLHDRALQVDRRLVSLLPHDAVVHYNLACSLTLLGESREAIQALRRALQLGYDDLDFLEGDPDLDGIRGEPEFRALLDEYLDRPGC